MRIKQIDFLRGVAILLVLLSHHNIFSILFKSGWMGVDLFFVLSGFLVSGLLFTEYKKYNKIDAKRFLIRRGFKIYPSFFVLLIISFIINYFTNELEYKQLLRYLCEITFTQNYTSAVWGQTWSLAVEEHFYFFLITSMVVYVKFKKKLSLKDIAIFCFIFFILCLVLRYLTHFFHPEYSVRIHHFPTHLRIDSMLFGVLLSAHYHLARDRFISFFNKYLPYLLFLSLMLLSVPFIFSVKSYFISTIGFTLLYIGFGILNSIFIINKSEHLIFNNFIVKSVFNLLSWIGIYSYTIYLFHMLYLKYLTKLYQLGGFDDNNILFSLGFLAGSVLIGVAVSKIIEIPALKLRDKFFPKRGENEREVSTLN